MKMDMNALMKQAREMQEQMAQGAGGGEDRARGVVCGRWHGHRQGERRRRARRDLDRPARRRPRRPGAARRHGARRGQRGAPRRRAAGRDEAPRSAARSRARWGCSQLGRLRTGSARRLDLGDDLRRRLRAPPRAASLTCSAAAPKRRRRPPNAIAATANHAQPRRRPPITSESQCTPSITRVPATVTGDEHGRARDQRACRAASADDRAGARLPRRTRRRWPSAPRERTARASPRSG